MQSQPCIVGTGPRTETCGGCFYLRYAPGEAGVDARWAHRCLHPSGYRVGRSKGSPACPNHKPNKPGV